MDHGVVRAAGDSFECSDGCNQCWCNEDGTISSTLMACTGRDGGRDPGKPTHCIEGGIVRAIGERFQCSDGCNHCACNEDGTITSTLMLCTDVDAGLPPKGAGPNPADRCILSDRILSRGETFACDCNTCRCDGNDSISSTAMGCITDAGSPETGALPEAGPGGGPSTCSVGRIWAADSDGFKFVSSGGETAPAPDCPDGVPSSSYVYSRTTKTILERSCSAAGRVNRVIDLTDAKSSEILAIVSGLRSSCQKDTCGADLPMEVLEIRDGAHAVQGTFYDDFYAGCSSAPPRRSYVDYASMSRLSAALRNAGKVCAVPQAEVICTDLGSK